MSFRMQTLAESFARISIDRASITPKLHENEYLLLSLTTLANQLAKADVSAYVNSDTGATTVVPPTESACHMCKTMYSLKRSTDTYVCLCALSYIIL